MLASDLRLAKDQPIATYCDQRALPRVKDHVWDEWVRRDPVAYSAPTTNYQHPSPVCGRNAYERLHRDPGGNQSPMQARQGICTTSSASPGLMKSDSLGAFMAARQSVGARHSQGAEWEPAACRISCADPRFGSQATTSAADYKPPRVSNGGARASQGEGMNYGRRSLVEQKRSEWGGSSASEPRLRLRSELVDQKKAQWANQEAMLLSPSKGSRLLEEKRKSWAKSSADSRMTSLIT